MRDRFVSPARRRALLIALAIAGPFVLALLAPLAGVWLPTDALRDRVQPDLRYDGALVGERDGRPFAFPAASDIDAIAPVEPARESYGKQHPEGSGAIIFINGIGAPWRSAYADAKALADQTGRPVVNVHVATWAFPDGIFSGTLVDALDALAVDVGLVRNRAAESLASAIERRLARGEPVHLVAHSKGAIVTARALRTLLAQGTPLERIEVETYASAEPAFPDGPQYVHYVDTDDLVPMLVGVGRPFAHPGYGARVIAFADWRFGIVDWSLAANHHLVGAYLTDERVPFRLARTLDPRRDPLAIARYVTQIAHRSGARPRAFFDPTP